MPNVINIAIHADYERLFQGTVDGLFVQPLGMSVADADAFREKLAGNRLGMRVLKGSLARRVLEARGLSGVAPMFTGPAAFIGAAEGQSVDCAAITAAKVLAEWRKQSGAELPALKGGVLEGQVLDARAANGLQKMPGKREIQARIAAQILAPGRRLSAQFIAGGGRLAGALGTHISNLEKKAG
ncbi:MAG: 50S ribosomal protein L10 [Planctomycetes bacterium]|nr:50S ribosomal protein L10 [Planctomycetota bacterium]